MKNMKLLVCHLIILLSVISLQAKEAISEKTRIAIMDFDTIGVGQSHAELGRAVCENLRTDLIKTGKYIVIERNALVKLFKEQELQFSGAIDQDTAVKIGKMTGAQMLVLGSVTKIAETFTINVRFIDIETGVATKAERLQGSVNELPNLIEGIVKLILGEEWTPKTTTRRATRRATTKSVQLQQPRTAKKNYDMLGYRSGSNFKVKGEDELVSGGLYKNAYNEADEWGIYVMFSQPEVTVLAMEMAYDHLYRNWDIDGYSTYKIAKAEWSLNWFSLSLLAKKQYSFLSPHIGIGVGMFWWRDNETYQLYSYSNREDKEYYSNPKLGTQVILGLDLRISNTFTMGIETRTITVKIDEVNSTIDDVDKDPIEGDFGVEGQWINAHVAINF